MTNTAISPMSGGPRLALGLLLMMALACASSTGPHAPAPPWASALHWESRLDIDHPLVGVVWDVAAKRPVTERELSARVQSSTIVLVGEAHDNPDHHRLQARLL